jgi:hypothetical protein
MPRPKGESSVRVQVVLPESQAKWLTRQAQLLGEREGRIISLSEFIRGLINDAHPMPVQPKQPELFK